MENARDTQQAVGGSHPSYHQEDASLSRKKLFTTGEAAKLLNISRSTVSRKFDKGILQGKKNPITGERLIGYKSLEALIKQYDLRLPPLPAERKSVLLVSSDRLLTLLLEKNLLADDRFEIHKLTLGSDAMVFCSRDAPHLVIVDDELPDMACQVVINSVRQTSQRAHMKTICYASKDRAAQCMKCAPDKILNKGSLDEEDLIQTIHLLVDLAGTYSSTQTFEHHRVWPRVPVDFPARISVYLLNDPHLRYSGRATMKNISHGGAYLSGIIMDEGIIPSDPFRLVLEVDEAPLEKWRADCMVVRLQSDKFINAGVQFSNLSGRDLKKVTAVVGG